MGKPYNKLDIKLSRYSFEEKINILNVFSSRIFRNGVDVNLPLPWELETIALFVIKNKEIGSNKFKNYKEFLSLIQEVRSYDDPRLDTKQVDKTNIDSVNTFLSLYFIASMPSQRPIQINIRSAIFRYNYLFDYVDDVVDIKSNFIKKFGFSYTAIIIWILELRTIIFTNSEIDEVKWCFNSLMREPISSIFSVTRAECSDLIDKFSLNKIENYSLCVKPFNIYPFIIEDDAYYIPLPHCIDIASTYSLCYRLTDGNKKLKDNLGYVCEKYIYSITNDTNIYEEILSEQKYKGKENSERKTSDVMIKNNNNIIFVEVKSSVPFMDTRLLDKDKMNIEKSKIVDSVIELYRQIVDEFIERYNFFNNKENIEKNHRFGIVAILEHSFFDFDEILNDVKNKLFLSDKDFEWLLTHIKIMDFEMYEKYVMTNTNFIDENSLSFISSDKIVNEIQNKKCNELFHFYLESANFELKEMVKNFLGNQSKND